MKKIMWQLVVILGMLHLGWLSSSQPQECQEIYEECQETDKECRPEQIHLAFGEKTNDITITWSTLKDAGEGIVEYGEHSTHENHVPSERTVFVDGGTEKRKQYINVVRLRDLKHDTGYVYRVSSKYGRSATMKFRTPPAGSSHSVSVLVYGDLGIQEENFSSLDNLIAEAKSGAYNFVLHTGDFAYDMPDDQGRRGDQFMNNIQPIASTLPYMVCPGNHEYLYNFSHYRARFSMPGGAESMFYSFDLGPVHFVSLNTEAYYDDRYYTSWLPGDNETMRIQYEWFQKDLAEANKPENRAKRPWIIVYGHRPMYCTNNNRGDHCRDHHLYIHRMGYYGLEPFLKQYGVDLCIWAHEHSYERMWPIYDYKMYNGSDGQPYVDPRSPVHITSGSAGCSEETDSFYANPEPWSAFRSSDYGYTRMKVYNSTHLHIEQISTHSPSRQTTETKWLMYRHDPVKIDELWLVKHQHKTYDI